MTSKPCILRLAHARDSDSDRIARFYRAVAGAEWPFLVPHTPDEDRAFFARCLADCTVWLAEDADGVLTGFCAARAGWIDHLFVAHARQGEGIGQALLAASLKRRRRVRLWTFQRNTRSRAFYARQGFLEVRLTDGSHNEEREPDVLLEWRRGQ